MALQSSKYYNNFRLILIILGVFLGGIGITVFLLFFEGESPVVKS